MERVLTQSLHFCGRLAGFLAVALGAGAATVHAEVMAVPALVRALETADYGRRADFARVAMDELILAYEQVLDRRAMAAPSLGGKTDLRRWRAATDGFLAQLYAARERLERGDDVQVVLGPDATAVLYVGRQPVLVSGPDADSTQRLQQQVVERFCAVHACAGLVQASIGGVASTHGPQPAATQAHWSFAQDRQPSFVFGHGLRFVYDSVRDRDRKEQVSRQVAAELLQLAEALQTAAWSGERIQWQQLRLEPRRHGGLERLVLARTGAGLSLSAPLLAQSPALWREALPWLQARVQGHEYEVTFWQADRLLGGGAGYRPADPLPAAMADRR